MIGHGVEREYKQLVTEEQFTIIRDSYRQISAKMSYETIYYSDQNMQALKAQAVLRLRLLSGGTLLTFKIKTTNQLQEYEKADTDFKDPEVINLLAQYGLFPPFIEIAKTSTIRYLVELPKAELCIDQTIYSEDYCDYEIEYELKAAHDAEAALAEFINILSKFAVSYQPNPLSKFQRALAYYHINT